MVNQDSSKKWESILRWPRQLKNYLLKFTRVGKKMISASNMNSELNDVYAQLGKYVYVQTKEGHINLSQGPITEFVQAIDQLKSKLEKYENEVIKIKTYTSNE